MSRIEVVYTPPTGSGLPSLKFGNDSHYEFLLLSHDGLLSNAATPAPSKGPGQVGVTAIDSITDARMISIQAAIVGASAADHWNLRRKLARGLAVTPVRPGETMALGTLIVVRGAVPSGNKGFQPGTVEQGTDLFTDMQIRAIPRNSPLDSMKNDNATIADIEFWCPYPYFMPRTNSTQTITTSGTVTNVGEQYAPLTIAITGPVTRPRIVNATTGESLEVGDDVPSGHVLNISTEFGDKYVRRDGKNLMGLVNPKMADFWSLKPGAQTVQLVKAAGSGSMLLTWRPRYSGI